jgi:hypothetical protein
MRESAVAFEPAFFAMFELRFAEFAGFDSIALRLAQTG